MEADQYGEVIDFPIELEHFSTLLIGSEPGQVFALVVVNEIRQASIQPSDFIIFDMGKFPQPGDICIAPIGQRLFLIRVMSKTYGEDTPSLELAQQYPIPENLTDPMLKQDLNWVPLALDDDNPEYFIKVVEEQDWPIKAMKPEFIVATALRLVRALAF
jgi:hypothetical protein